MAEPAAEQSRAARVCAQLICAALAVALVAVSAVPLLGPVGADVVNSEIRLSAHLAVLFWCFAWPIAFARSPDHTAPRVVWAIGCLLLLVHVAVAFHLGHGWSHRAAWEHTRAVGGYGGGVFVNYAFALVWSLDAIWALVAFDSYRARPRWVNGAIHGFLAFVVFNAALVFASWDTRVRFLAAFLTVLSLLLRARAKRSRRVDAPHAD